MYFKVMRHLASRKMPIKFFIIEGLISIKVDVSTLPEHSRKPYSGKKGSKLNPPFAYS